VSDAKCQKALAAVLEEVVKLIARHDAPPDVQRRLGVIESICRSGVDTRTPEEKSSLANAVDNDETLSEVQGLTTPQGLIRRKGKAASHERRGDGTRD
jgi:hypothetical protein